MVSSTSRSFCSPNVPAAIRARGLRLCQAASVRPEPAAIWRALEGHDALAYGLARLLLMTDPHPLPVAEDAAWACYADRLWQPGAPHRACWACFWAAAAAEYPAT